MAKEVKLSVSDKLVVTAARLGVEGKAQFSAEDLVVNAWKNFPHTFGLSGHQDSSGKPAYPDSNRVFAEIMGSKPIRKRGLLVKTGEKTYELTPAGRELAAHLEGALKGDSGEDRSKARAGFDRIARKRIEQLLESRAVQKVDNGQQEMLSFFDACIFWGITPQSSSIELESRLSQMTQLLTSVRESLGGNQARFAHGGKLLGQETLALLEKTHATLQKTFETQLVAIRKRTDQRKV